MTSYDEIQYPTRTYVQTHPDRLAAMGTLAGLHPRDPREARVLEIGCGDGMNLIAMAHALPEATFIGIDLAPTAIERGRGWAAELGLQNVRLQAADLAAAEETGMGEFDYIIAHGFFSWVPEAVRTAMLALCQQRLAPEGIAYVSYNCYPGCHLRETAWHMMRYHAAQQETPRDQVRQSRALLDLVIRNRSNVDEAYHKVLEEALEHALEYNEAAFFHDDLSHENQPFYLHQFLELAATHGLRFLGEADVRNLFFGNGSKPVAALLREMEKINPEAKEQYLDFLTGRRFRQTLLCRAERPIELVLEPTCIRPLRIAAQLEPAPAPEEFAAGSIYYRGPRNSEIAATDPALQRVLATLHQLWPQSIPVAALTADAQESDRQRIERFLFEAVKGGVAELRLLESPLTTEISPRPEISALARWQLDKVRAVTTLLHTRVVIEEPAARTLLPLMNGERDHRQLAEAAAPELLQNDIAYTRNGQPCTSREELTDALQEDLPNEIRKLARLGLLRR